MLNLNNYKELAAISGITFAFLLVVLVLFIKLAKPSKKTWLNSSVITYFITGCAFVPMAYGAAQVLKTTCNTWYHNDAKFVGPIGMAVFGVPLMMFLAYKVKYEWRRQIKEREGGKSLWGLRFVVVLW